MNKKAYNNYFQEEEEERDFRRYQLDEDSEFESKLEAKNIIKAFIQTENDAEEIKSKALNKKPSYWKEQKDNTNDLYTRKLDDDIELALDIINKRRDIPKQPEKDNVLLNMELRHAKIKQMKEDRIKSKQEAEFNRLQAQAQKFRPPSANASMRSSNNKGNASLQSSSKKSQVGNDWENQSQQSRPASKQSQLNYQNSRQTFQTQSGASLNNYNLNNDMSLTDLAQTSQQGSSNPKSEIQVLKSKRQNLEVQSKKMEEDMKKMKENLRKELFQNNDSSMISNRNGGSNINETIDYLQKEADESRMKYNQFRLQKLVKAYNFVLKRYKRLFYNQVFETLKQKNREYQRHEQQCVNIMRLKKLFVVFSSWKKYVYSQKDEKDVKFYLQEKIHENTFLNRAGEYYKRRLIRICLRHWKKYWKICKQEQKLNEEKNNLKYKIKGFISNLKQNIQQSEVEAQNQKEQQKQRVIEQFLRLNASQSEQNIQEDEQEEIDQDDEQQLSEQSQNNGQKRQINYQQNDQTGQPKQIEKANLNAKQSSRQGTERNNLRSSMASQSSAQSDNKPTRDNFKNQEKSPNLNTNNRVQLNNKDLKGTPQKKQALQSNNRSPVQQSPQTSNNKQQPYNKYENNKPQREQLSRQFQQNQSYSPQQPNQKYQQYYDEDEDQGKQQQEQQYYYDQNDFDDQDENQQYSEEDQYQHDYDEEENQFESYNYEGHESMMTDIARSRAPMPSQSDQQQQQITFRQSKSPNQRQNSKGHSESQMSGQTNKEKEREERLRQIQQRNEDRKKKAEEFKKKHEELRKQKEEEKKRKELEEIEKEREKRKEEFENYQKKKREEKEKKEKAEKEKKLSVEKLLLAKNHHQKSIQKYYGFKPWLKYMEFQEHLIVVANQFSYMRILKNGLQYLYTAAKINKQLFQQEMEYKEEKAIKHYQKTVLKKGFELIQSFSQQSKEEAEVYRKQRVDYLKRTVFYKWNDVLTSLRNENVAFEEQYKQIIIQFRKVVLQERSFRSWKQCINEEKIERIKAQQKNELRSKANQWLSEFKSSKNTNPDNQNQQQDDGDKLSEQLRISTFEDINKSQVKNEALQKYYNQRNKILSQKDDKDKQISSDNQIQQNKFINERNEEEDKQSDDSSYENYQLDNNQDQYYNEDELEDYQQSDEKYNHQNGENSDQEDDYQSILKNHQNMRVIHENKNYDLPLVQVLQNTNELSEKLARNNSKSKNITANK